ncbi:MAG TPA: SusC/RagA family TonB-linked outer membrane protein, partial [Bacteroidales bacterium]|nr:SusC/RagA family TonB-linked outer membrane protein [Bacteroidales bacterium]
MSKFYALILFSVLSLSLFGQEKAITGKVTGADGMGLPGVTVLVIGTSTGTVTDLDGFYKLSVSQGATLRFSYIGYATQEIPVQSQTTIDVVLAEDISLLNEVVVIGYGTQKKADLTTAVATVGEEVIKERPIVSPVEALQGKAAGVQVVQPSGKPGADLSVRVRGSTSVLAGNEPLYVVDGVPTTDISGLNPSDIESMTVLKDASSAAIYGARAANGVVLVTTKRGKENIPVVSFSTYFGASKLRKTIDVLNTFDYRELINEIQPGSLDPAATDFGVWSDSVFGTGTKQSYQLSVAGGSEKTRYFVSGGYLSDQGIIEPARFDRTSFRINLDNDINRWLKIGTNLNIVHSRTKDTPDNASSGRGGVIMSTLNTPPFLHIWKDDSAGWWYDPNPFQPSWENPVAYMDGPDQESIDNRL